MGKLIWLASYPKSGNTWLRAFLHNLLRNPNEPYDINRLTDFTIQESIARWYEGLDPRPVVELALEDVARLRPLAQKRIADSRPDLVLVKTHNMMAAEAGHPLINMAVTAGAIYLVRNPLDIVLSYADHLGQSIDETIELMARTGARTGNVPGWVSEVVGSWSEHVESWTSAAHPALLVVRYEDLLANASATFGAIVKFLKVPAPPERLQRAIRQSSFKVLQGQEEAKGFKERSRSQAYFFRAGKAGSWQTELSPDQVARIVGVHREQMARFRYVPD
ncbi:MAG: sulfotransferase domain-containing protein [Alphaproteobacteria bacterium]|nr:sulfotransferase domain-containing protein [Alphaproteobacteria bacterium]